MRKKSASPRLILWRHAVYRTPLLKGEGRESTGLTPLSLVKACRSSHPSPKGEGKESTGLTPLSLVKACRSSHPSPKGEGRERLHFANFFLCVWQLFNVADLKTFLVGGGILLKKCLRWKTDRCVSLRRIEIFSSRWGLVQRVVVWQKIHYKPFTGLVIQHLFFLLNARGLVSQ